MTDRGAVALALAAVAGAWLRVEVPAVVVALSAAGTLALGWARRTAVAVVAVLLLAVWLGGRAWDGLTPDSAHAGQAIAGTATLVSDPERLPGGVQVDVSLGGMRLRAVAPPAAGRLASGAAGERWHVEGRYSPLDAASRARLASRHIAGRLRVRAAHRVDGGSPLAVVSNALRRTLLDGTRSMAPRDRSLFAGVVLGDDRGQDPTEIEDFRSSGLSHLLAVSGQNVVFLLALLHPLLARLGLAARFVAVLAVLGVFGTVTRWEPSVMRAVAMGSIAALASTLGRQVSPLRVLSLAVTGLVLIDPLVVLSIGFALSVSACAGLVLLAPLLRRRLAEPLAVTVSAQVAVLPLLLTVFGPVPLVSVVANLLAAPVAGPLMMWGIAGGFVAGVAGEPMATALHVPTRVLLGAVRLVARWSASLAVPWITPRVVVVVALAGAAGFVVCRRLHVRPPRGALAAAGVVALLGVSLMPSRASGAGLDTGGDDALWREGAVVVVVTDAAAPPGRLLGALRSRRVRAIDVLVVTSGARNAGANLEPVLRRLSPSLVLAPAESQVPGAVAIETAVVVRAGPFSIDLAPDGDRLRPRIGSARATRPG